MMHSEWQNLSTYLKKAVAAVLFLLLLIGGAAAVLSAAAATLDSLSGPNPAVVVSSSAGATTEGTSFASGETSPTQTDGTSAQPGTTQPGTTPSQGTQSQGAQSQAQTSDSQPKATSSTASAASQDVMETPVVDALDKGGIIVGNSVQNVFGDILANALQVLFVERPVPVNQVSTVDGTQTPSDSNWVNP